MTNKIIAPPTQKELVDKTNEIIDELNALQSGADIDLSNVSTNGKMAAISWGMPDYTAGITNLTFPYTAPADGILYFTGFNMDTYNAVYVNEIQIAYPGGERRNVNSVTIILSKNDIVTTTFTNFMGGCYFFPMKGANNA